MKVAIIKYNAGNIYSVVSALKRVGIDPLVTDDQDQLMSADKVLFPGVGHAHSAMEYLRFKGLDRVILDLKQPVLGICLGMQILCAKSDEGDTTCLGIFDETVKVFERNRPEQKIPHMGWNNLSDLKSPLMANLHEKDFVYFVHSYYVGINANTIATTEYIHPFSAAIAKNNFYATQFHPEKSGSVGEIILKNFLALK